MDRRGDASAGVLIAVRIGARHVFICLEVFFKGCGFRYDPVFVAAATSFTVPAIDSRRPFGLRAGQGSACRETAFFLTPPELVISR
jgi:hypothetical protein